MSPPLWKGSAVALPPEIAVRERLDKVTAINPSIKDSVGDSRALAQALRCAPEQQSFAALILQIKGEQARVSARSEMEARAAATERELLLARRAAIIATARQRGQEAVSKLDPTGCSPVLAVLLHRFLQRLQETETRKNGVSQ